MPVISITLHDMVTTLSESKVPEQLVNHINIQQWKHIHDSIRSARQSGQGCACCIEWTVCLLTPFWCIFCYHPCISECVSRGAVQKNMNSANTSLFQGRSVLSIQSGSIYFNTDVIPIVNTAPQIMTVQPQYAEVQLVPQQVQYAQIAQAEPDNIPKIQEVQLQSLMVKIPEGCPPGGVLSVLAPNGQTISVTAPADSYPGKEIMVQY